MYVSHTSHGDGITSPCGTIRCVHVLDVVRIVAVLVEVAIATFVVVKPIVLVEV